MRGPAGRVTPTTEVAPTAPGAAAGGSAAAGRPVDLVIHARRAIIDGREQAASLAIRMGRIVGIGPFGTAPPSRLVVTLNRARC